MKDGSVANGVSFLALWGGVVLGALVAVIACVAGLTRAARERHQRWLGALLVGSLVPLVVCVLLVNSVRAAHPYDPTLDPRREVVALVIALVLAALAPLVPLVYGAWAAYQEGEPSSAAFATGDALDA